MQARKLSSWPVPGGLLERLGRPPGEIEGPSRKRALDLARERWHGHEAELVASLLYASGDPDLLSMVQLDGDPVGSARRALQAGAAVLVDVTMVSAGIRLPPGQRMAVAVRQPGAEEMARRSGITRAAAGIKKAWDEFGARGVVAVGNAPTALLAVLDLAQHSVPPSCVIATCPGFTVATEAKQALADSGLPYLAVAGTRGGSGLAAAAMNLLLGSA